MTPIKAFVGHSFTEDDEIVVGKFLKYLDQITEMHPSFTWVHAEAAEPRVIDAKVLSLFDSKNLFIAICTKKERVVAPRVLKGSIFTNNRLSAKADDFGWKTSDWIIQEIGLAIGRGLNVVLLVEQGLRSPGGLQGNLERIEFEKDAPEKVFGKLIEMISALTPKTANVTLAEPESQSSPPEEKNPIQAPEGADWRTPKPEWKRQNYEIALIHSVIIDDQANQQSISDNYLATELGSRNQNQKTWEAFKEYTNLNFGKGGSLSHLTKLADENPTMWEIVNYVARIYLKYEEYGKAAVLFERAAGEAGDIHEELKLLGEAALAYQKAKDANASFTVITQMRYKCADASHGEIDVLLAIRKLAEITEDDEISIGTMERQLELNPDDIDTRFAIAYKYSEQGNDALAAMHYARIAYAERTAVTWNNLGVAFARMGMQAKSVDAYRKSEEMGETLAMSNLANKLIENGFLSEAQKICEEALRLKDVNKNIGSTLGRIKEVPEEEEKKKSEELEKVRPISEFYKAFGRAVVMPMPKMLAARWQGPDCILDLTLSGAVFYATGTFERSSGGGLLAAGIFGGGGVSGKPSLARYRVEYKGIARGQAIVASVVREKEDEQAKANTLLGIVGEDRLTVLMLLSVDGSEIVVYEKEKTGGPRFYCLQPCSVAEK
jgi:tetratricopeptide (TPR) repeat protein